MLGFCSSPRLVEHRTGPHHPERPDRLRAIYAAVRAAGLLPSPDPLAEAGAPAFDLGPKRPDPADVPKVIELDLPAVSLADLERRTLPWVATCHVAPYAARIKHFCEAGGGVLDGGDTPVGVNSYEIGLIALSAVLRCCDAVMGGEAKRAFAAVRPPGHHADPERPMGFCLFANVAIAARYLQRHHGVGRVAVVDFDVHHGNGTQACVEEDASVYFVSLHQHPRTLYPGSGYDWERGTGAGEGYTMNVPFDPGSGDDEYVRALEGKVLPALEAFDPQVLLISAGFDAHRDDPLAKINLSDAGFERITRLLVGFANQHCAGRVVSSLEGGYNLAALGRAVVRHLMALGIE